MNEHKQTHVIRNIHEEVVLRGTEEQCNNYMIRSEDMEHTDKPFSMHDAPEAV